MKPARLFLSPRWFPLCCLLSVALLGGCAINVKKVPPPGCMKYECAELFENVKPLDPNADDDGDGIKNDLDGAPLLAEDKDGDRDEDGIPDTDVPGQAAAPKGGKGGPISKLVQKPNDADNDGIIDAYDLCYDQPEDVDFFEDDDGCPDNDNDNDGTPDATDPCPNVPGTWCTPDKKADSDVKSTKKGA